MCVINQISLETIEKIVALSQDIKMLKSEGRLKCEPINFILKPKPLELCVALYVNPHVIISQTINCLSTVNFVRLSAIYMKPCKFTFYLAALAFIIFLFLFLIEAATRFAMLLYTHWVVNDVAISQQIFFL